MDSPEAKEQELVSAIVRAFWRRIYPFRNRYERELPDPLPVEFEAHMTTALTLMRESDAKRIEELESYKDIVDESASITSALAPRVAAYLKEICDGDQWEDADSEIYWAAQNIDVLVASLSAKVSRYEKECARLFQLLDNIDTAEDVFKPEITHHFNYVNKQHRQRFDGPITTDGYKLFFDGEQLKQEDGDDGC